MDLVAGFPLDTLVIHTVDSSYVSVLLSRCFRIAGLLRFHFSVIVRCEKARRFVPARCRPAQQKRGVFPYGKRLSEIVQ
jgi:hypothetical protein